MLYGYDALNRISNIHYGNGVETAYTYDGNGNHTAKTGTQATLGDIISGSNALDLSYAYDVRGQLLEERRNGASVCYAYDKAGNRIRKTDAQGEIRYLYNEKNQLVEEESPADRKQFSYDRQGGIIEEKNAAGIRRFSYNSRHQQTRVETENGNVQENRYDAEGLRFELLENGRRTSFVYHNGELLQEEGREEQGTSYHLGAGMEAFRRGQELSYYHRDEQLSTVFVTDGQGEIRNSYQYDAFGIPLETTEQLNNRIRYTGQQYDDVTGQYYLRARYYNPVAGRFMQEDVYQGDGLNLYAYCGNNPVVYDDPSGYKRKACPPQGKISESVDETSYGKSSSNCTELVPYYPANNGAESGRKADFYVTPSGDVVPATGYRYMDSGRANDAIISGEQYTTYIGFKKYDSASQVKDAFQIADSWSDCKVRGEFDTLQVIDDLYVPTTKGNTTAIPEPITFSYPEYGKGGEHQLRVDKVIKFTNVDFIGD